MIHEKQKRKEAWHGTIRVKERSSTSHLGVALSTKKEMWVMAHGVSDFSLELGSTI